MTRWERLEAVTISLLVAVSTAGMIASIARWAAELL